MRPWAVGLPLAVALIVRLACLPLARELPHLADARGYLFLLQEYREFGHFAALLSGVRPPLPRVLLAPGLDTSVHPYDPFPGVFLLQIGLDLLTCALLMALAWRHFGPRAAAVTGWAFALFPPAALSSSTVILAETPYLLACSALLLALDGLDRVLVEQRKPWRRAFVLGLLVGLGLLTRETFVMLSVLVVLVVVGGAGPRRQRLVAAGLVLATAGAVVAPWAVRNRLTYGTTIVSGTYDTLGLMLDNGRPGTDMLRTWIKQPSYAERFARAREVFVSAIVDEPALLLRRASTRLRIALGPEDHLPLCVAIAFEGFSPSVSPDLVQAYREGWRLPEGSWGRRLQLASGAATALVFGLGLGGLAASGATRLRRLGLLALLATLLGVALTVASARYRLVLLPFLLPFTGVLWATSEARTRRRGLVVACLVAAALLITMFVLPAPPTAG